MTRPAASPQTDALTRSTDARSAAAQPTSPGSPGAVAGADPYRVHGEIKLPVGLGLSARFATTTRFNLRRLTLVAFLTRGVHGPVGAVAATRVEVR